MDMTSARFWLIILFFDSKTGAGFRGPSHFFFFFFFSFLFFFGPYMKGITLWSWTCVCVCVYVCVWEREREREREREGERQRERESARACHKGGSSWQAGLETYTKSMGGKERERGRERVGHMLIENTGPSGSTGLTQLAPCSWRVKAICTSPGAAWLHVLCALLSGSQRPEPCFYLHKFLSFSLSVFFFFFGGGGRGVSAVRQLLGSSSSVSLHILASRNVSTRR